MSPVTELFKGSTRKDMTPCMRSFESWWAQNRNAFSNVSVETAWRIFRNGWWSAEDQGAP